jgi:aconitate decarboxylase
MGRGRTRVVVRFSDGATLASSKLAARSVLEPLSNEEVVAKYRSLTRGVLDIERQAKLERLVLALDRLADARELIEVLSGAVVSPFE